VYGARVRRVTGAMAYPRHVGAKQASKLDLALLLTLTTIVLWALNIPVVKIGLDGWSPMAFSFIRFASGGIIYVAYVLWRERSLRVRRKDIPLFVIGGAIGIAINQYAFMYALEETTASVVTLVFATTPLWAALLARALGWEFVKPWFWPAVGISAVGVFLVLIGTGATMSFGSAKGILIAFGAPITWGMYSVLVRPLLKDYSAMHVSAIMMMVGAPLIGIVGVPQALSMDWSKLVASSWIALIYALVGSLILANLFWFVAIHRAGSARAVALMPLQPFIGVLFSALLLSEHIDWKEGVGGVIIIIGVTIAVRSVVPIDKDHDQREIGIQE
jgi:drug/metabolite transporter (DMT)-like permease